jgi:hypothetical protein
MASGHVNRANRPNTWLHRPVCNVKKVLANSEPSTHGAKRPFVRKQDPVTDKEKVESLSIWNQARGAAFSRSQWEAAKSMLRWRVQTSGPSSQPRFIPSEPNAAVASVIKPVGGCVAGYRAISQIRLDVGRGGIRTIVSIAVRRAGQSPVRLIARIGCCASPQSTEKSLVETIRSLKSQPRNNPGYVENDRGYSSANRAEKPDFSATCGAVIGFGMQGRRLMKKRIRVSRYSWRFTIRA